MTGNGVKDHPEVGAGFTQAELKCLLAILELSEEEGRAATNRIARALQVKPPTVCRVLDRLLAGRLITREPYGKVELTLRGKRIACRMNGVVSLLQNAIICRLHLAPGPARQTALFLACTMDEDSLLPVLSCARGPDGAACACDREINGLQEVIV